MKHVFQQTTELVPGDSTGNNFHW